MSIVNPPLFLTVDGHYTGAHLGLPYRDIVGEGVVGVGDYAVSERGAGANMSVDVAAGVAWVRGDESEAQPTYRVRNDGTVNLAISAADPTNDRIDLVVLEVLDSAFAGVSLEARLRVVEGTPAADPSAPATPNNALPLAQVLVEAQTSDIEDADITDTRPRFHVGTGMVLLGEAGAGASAAFSVPQNFSHLRMICYLRGAETGNAVPNLNFNGDTGPNYDWQRNLGSGNNALVSESAAQTGLRIGTAPGSDATAGVFSGFVVDIPNYANDVGHKVVNSTSLIKLGAATNLQAGSFLGAWRSTDPISSIVLSLSTGDLAAGSKVSLYGLP